MSACACAFDRGDDVRVAMTGRGHRDARVEVEEAVAVDVLDDAARARAGTSGWTRASDGLVTRAVARDEAAARGPGSSVRSSGTGPVVRSSVGSGFVLIAGSCQLSARTALS